jgi:FkbM family methyltransferase
VQFYGVSDNNGITELNIVERGWEKNYIRESKGSGSMQTGSIISKKHIVTVTLDWLSNYFPPPDVLKIDIKGAEYMALNSGKHILKEKRPIIYIEIQGYNKSLSQ